MVIKRYAAKSRATPKPPVFTCKWDTTQAGSSNDTVVLPLVSNGSYNFQVDWGDGTRETITAHNQAEKTHQYASTGIYEVRIIGDISGWYFNNGGDDDKIIEISSWGPLTITDGYRVFYGCSNLDVTAIDAPTLTTNRLHDTFRSCPKIGNKGNMNFWDTSSVTNMDNAFYQSHDFNQPIGNWDVSNVTNMRSMLNRCFSFNQPIGDWDVSQVTTMAYMFDNTSSTDKMSFDQDIGNWDVGNVTSFREFMRGYYSSQRSPFNNGGSSSISGWDTSSVTDMYHMFYGCTGFNQPIGSWDTSKVTNMQEMLRNCPSFNQDLSNWNVTGVTNFQNFFYNNPVFNNGGSTGINNWRPSSCTTMHSMFNRCFSFNQPIGDWDVSQVTTMAHMFDNTSSTQKMSFDQDIGNWDVGNVTRFREFARGYYSSQRSPFTNGGSSSISGWDTSSVTDMYHMFYGCTGFNQPIGSWDTSKVTNMQEMLRNCPSFDQDLSNWNVTGVTNFQNFFYNNPVFNNGGSTGINNWRPSSCTTMHSMFNRCFSFNQPIGDWDVSQVTTMAHMFDNTSSTQKMSFDQDIGNWDVGNVTRFREFARGYYSSQRSPFTNGGSSSISGWDTSSVTDMYHMFYGCTGFNQPIGSWDTSKVTNMQEMLRNCPSFNQDLSNWNVTGVTNFQNFFYNNPVFNNGGSTGINNWRPSSCTTMRSMFNRCFSFNQPIGDWDVSQVTTMAHMFDNTSSTQKMSFDQDIGNWDVGNVTSFREFMRGYYSSQRSPFTNGGSSSISGWDTSSVTDMYHMFFGCTGFNQPIGSWDMSSVTNAGEFMRYCTLSTANYDSTLGGWSSQSVQNGVNIHFGNSQYSSATGAAYRTALVNAGWTITDGGQA